jgi:hypothetical protein
MPAKNGKHLFPTVEVRDWPKIPHRRGFSAFCHQRGLRQALTHYSALFAIAATFRNIS